MESSSKKIALISLFSEDVLGVPPLGLLYLATNLRKHGHQAKIIHRKAALSDSIPGEIDDYAPDLVGLSVFTGYNNKKYADLGRELKRRGHKIVLGNAHASLLPEDSLREEYVDFVIVGEGEETLLELVDNLDQPSGFPLIPGLGFKDSTGAIIINGQRPFIAQLDDYLIDWSLIDVESYLIPYFNGKCQRVFTITTSRGCPFNCQFCYNLNFNKRRWRAHSVEGIVANLKPLIEKFKIDGLRFFDDNFFVDKERAFKIVELLGLPYMAEARVEYVDANFVNRLKETKCQEILFGFESGSDRILKEVVCKGSSTDDIINAVTLFNGSGVVASGSMIFGFPSETQQEYRQTMKFIVKLLSINNNLAFTCGWFLPFPGSGLYERAKILGFLPPRRIEDWDIMNRWSQQYEMAWLDWDYKSAVKFSRQIVNLAAMAYKKNIPVLKTIFSYRAEHTDFRLPWDIYLFARIRDIYLFSGEKNALNRGVKKVLTAIVALRSRLSASHNN